MLFKVGDLVSIKDLSCGDESLPNYIIFKIEHYEDKAQLYKYDKYLLFDIITHKVDKEIIVWHQKNLAKYKLIKYHHNCYTYCYSLYCRLNKI